MDLRFLIREARLALTEKLRLLLAKRHAYREAKNQVSKLSRSENDDLWR